MAGKGKWGGGGAASAPRNFTFKVVNQILSFKEETGLHGTTSHMTLLEVDTLSCLRLYSLSSVHLPHCKVHYPVNAMSEFKHLVLVKFKDGVVVEDVLKGLEKLVSEMDTVKSFVWGQDGESLEVLRQGFTHAFLMTFGSKDDFTAFAAHPNHVEFSSNFSTVIEKAVLLDFPAVTVKPSA